MGRRTLVKYINLFDEDIFGKYRVISKKIRKQSSFSGLFMKKNYQEIINELENCQEKVLLISPEHIEVDSNDEEAIVIRDLLGEIVTLFYALCTAQINVQEFFIRKDNKESVSVDELKKLMAEVGKNNMGMKLAWEKITKIIR
ncbi:MAG: hypothetical protein RR495_00940 [Anaerovoracaceae bacterium]